MKGRASRIGDDTGERGMGSGAEFKETEIGKIRGGWHIITLGELVTFQRGHDLPKKNRKEGHYPVVASNGIVDYHDDFKVEGPGVTIGRSGNLGVPLYI